MSASTIQTSYRFTANESASDLFSCFSQDPVKCRLRDFHELYRLMLVHPEMILQSYALHLFQLQDHFAAVLQTGYARSPVIIIE